MSGIEDTQRPKLFLNIDLNRISRVLTHLGFYGKDITLYPWIGYMALTAQMPDVLLQSKEHLPMVIVENQRTGEFKLFNYLTLMEIADKMESKEVNMFEKIIKRAREMKPPKYIINIFRKYGCLNMCKGKTISFKRYNKK